MVASKGLTKAMPLRMTDEERATIERLRDEMIEAGLDASLNDVLRHLIRRAQMTPPLTEPAAREAIVAHWVTCPHCDATAAPRCLDGLHLQRTYAQVVSAPIGGSPATGGGVGSQGERAA